MKERGLPGLGPNRITKVNWVRPQRFATMADREGGPQRGKESKRWAGKGVAKGMKGDHHSRIHEGTLGNQRTKGTWWKPLRGEEEKEKKTLALLNGRQDVGDRRGGDMKKEALGKKTGCTVERGLRTYIKGEKQIENFRGHGDTKKANPIKCADSERR